jgi:hypothetical protein
VTDEQPFDQQAERSGGDESDRHRDEEITAVHTGKVRLEQVRAQIGHVGAEDHEFPVRHVDHTHLAEDDRKPERHEQEHREQDQPGKALHHQDRA